MILCFFIIPNHVCSFPNRTETLLPIMNSLIEWAGDNMAMILKDRQQKAV